MSVAFEHARPARTGHGFVARSVWLYLVPVALVTMALAVGARWPIGIGIGVAAGLSLSGSV